MQSYKSLAIITGIIFIIVHIPFGILGGTVVMIGAPKIYFTVLQVIYLLMYIIGIPLAAYIISMKNLRFKFWNTFGVLVIVPVSIITIFTIIFTLNQSQENMQSRQRAIKREAVITQLEQAVFDMPRYELTKSGNEYFLMAIVPSNIKINYNSQLLEETFTAELNGITSVEFNYGTKNIGNCQTGNYSILPHDEIESVIVIRWNFYGEKCSKNDLDMFMGEDITIKNRRTGEIVKKFPIDRLN